MLLATSPAVSSKDPPKEPWVGHTSSPKPGAVNDPGDAPLIAACGAGADASLVAVATELSRVLATRGELGEARVSADDLLGASLRMRPDRIILGELRGEEAYAFLRAINTGHPGSLSSVHANSAEAAVEQIALLILSAARV